MVKVDEQGNLTISRGDIGEFPLIIKDGDQYNWVKYYLQEGDYLEMYIFHIWERPQNYLKKIDLNYSNMNEDGDIIITLTREITEDLEEEKYAFQIKIFRESENFQAETLFTKRTLTILI